MKLHLLRTSTLGLALGFGASAFAQDIPFILTARPKHTFSTAVRMKSAGAKVKFGNLGSVGQQTNEFIPGTPFENGYVDRDGKRFEETAPTTTFSPDGTRYYTWTTATSTTPATQTGDLLAYQQGKTRNWAYLSADQVQGDAIEFTQYRSLSSGATAEAESDGSSPGFEIQLHRDIGTIGQKFSWGASFAFGLSSFSAGTSETLINSTLGTRRYRFSLLGQPAPEAPYTAPNISVDATTQFRTENTVPISDTPTSITEQLTANGAQVVGVWGVKGAYYSIRLGPSFRYQALRRLSVSGSAGVLGTYLGSTFRGVEHLKIGTVGAQFLAEKRSSDINIGYYAELNLEFWLTYRTGLFLGATYETMDPFTQGLFGRTADIEFDDGLAIRFGVITRF
jgi:hypothetical protein